MGTPGCGGRDGSGCRSPPHRGGAHRALSPRVRFQAGDGADERAREARHRQPARRPRRAAARRSRWEVDDLVKAAALVERSLGPLRILIGHGIAGAALLAASGAIEGVAGIVTIGAPQRARHVRRLRRRAHRGGRPVRAAGRNRTGADHLLSDSSMAAQVSRLVAGWAAEMVSRPSWPTPGASPCAA